MNQPLRIAQCMENPWDQHGGTEVLVREIATGLAKDHHVFVVTSGQAGLPPEMAGSFEWQVGADRVSEMHRLRDWMVENRIEIAHFHAGGTYGWGSRERNSNVVPVIAATGIRCCFTNHGAFSIFDCVAPYRPLPLKLLGLALFWPNKIREIRSTQWEATVSRNDLHSVQKWFFPVRSKFIQLYHSKIKETEVAVRVPKEKFILCLGTIGGRKGQHFLVEAFAQIQASFPDWKLVLAGRASNDDTYKRAVELTQKHRLADKVEFRHEVSDAQALDLLQRAGIFAMPSTAEGLGLSLQEAQFHRCACIGSRIGGIPELIAHEKTGILVPMADPPALAAGLSRLMRDEGLRVRFGEAGHQSIIDREMTSEGMVRNYLKKYREALKEHPGFAQ